MIQTSYIFTLILKVIIRSITLKLERDLFIQQLKEASKLWDFIVIGGGATGLGIAVDAASRGYSTVLLEQSDFAKGTSGRSTKLVHGGVRYLQKGDIGLVVEALRERGYLLKNAPHLVKNQRFIIANYRWWEKPFYTIGLTLYDLLSGTRSLGRSLPMSRKSVINRIPGIVKTKLRGGVSYHDGQFDDSRLAVNLMQTAVEHGATVLNYAKVTQLLKDESGKISGVRFADEINGGSLELKGHYVINATGVFVDSIIRMDNVDEEPLVRPSQGVHLVVDSSFLGGDDAIMVPKTSDGRVMFGVPWHNRTILGTTDIPVYEALLEPRALEEEIDFILETAGRYLEKKPGRQDVLCVFAGLRPLAAPGSSADGSKTREISRSHKLLISPAGLITITGGKWTTYRAMAEDTLKLALRSKKVPVKQCKTRHLKIHGYQLNPDRTDWMHIYGSDQEKIVEMSNENPEYARILHKDFDFTVAQVVWAVRNEMALTVDDVLARRIRVLFLDAKASVEMAADVAKIMATELKRDQKWERQQINEYNDIAKRYILA